MNFDRRHKRSTRTHKLDVECLGERIAPAVSHIGLLGGVHNLGVKHMWLERHEKLLGAFEHNGGRGLAVRHHKAITVWNQIPFLNVHVMASGGSKAPAKHPILVTNPLP